MTNLGFSNPNQFNFDAVVISKLLRLQAIEEIPFSRLFLVSLVLETIVRARHCCVTVNTYRLC